MHPLVISAYRMLIAAVLLLACLAITHSLIGLRRLLTRHPVRAALVGVGTAAYQGLYFSSVVWVGVSVSTVVSLGVAPLLLTAWESITTGSRPTATRLLVLTVALTGLVLVSAFGGDGGPTGPHPTWGVLAAVGSGTSYAATTALSRTLLRTASGVTPLVLTTAMTTVGAVALVPFVALGGPLLTGDIKVDLLLVYLGTLTMALAYGLLYSGLRTTSESTAVIATLVEPVTAALAAALFLDERLGPAGIVGTALVIAAVLGLERSPAIRPEPAGM